jgi:tetratricopeptide (TPR) repeat protein
VNIKKDIRRKLAESYIQLNDNPKALYWIKQYSKISKGKNREVSYLNAYLQEKSNPAKAKTLYAANTKSFPRDHRNFLRLGMMYSKRRNTLSKAVVMLKKAVALVDTIPAVWLEIAQVYGKLRKTNDELNAYKKYIQTDPENLEANIRVGLILVERNKISEGMGYLEKAHKKSPENVNVMVALAKGYVSSGRSQEALDLLTKAKKLKPGEPSIRRQLYAIYKEKGQDQQALDEIKQLLEIKRDSESLLLYAQLLMKSGDVTGAENAIEDIRATDPENIEALMILATIYREKKKYADAIDIYKEVNLIDSKYTPAINGQAQIHLIQNKILWAEKYFKNALKMDPDFASAELGLAKIAELRKDKAKYKKHLDRAYFLDPKDPEIKEEYQKSKK